MSKPPEAAKAEEIATLRIELSDSDPLIWREIELPTSVTLLTLHDIIQAAMGWDDSHLWEFRACRGRVGPQDYDFEAIDVGEIRLRDVMRPRRTRFEYVYDFGDCWEHLLIVGRPRPGVTGVPYPRLLGAECAAPPEDCGGMYGYYHQILAALADPEHSRHAEMAESFSGWRADDPGVAEINRRLARIAAARP